MSKDRVRSFRQRLEQNKELKECHLQAERDRDKLRRVAARERALKSKRYAEERRTKERERKQKQRKSKAVLCEMQSDGRSDSAKKRRMQHSRKQRETIKKLVVKLNIDRKRAVGCKKKIPVEQPSTSGSPNSKSTSVSSLVWSNITPRSKRKVKLNMQNSSTDLPRGTCSAVRRALGINLSNDCAVGKADKTTDLSKNIIDFFNRDDVSKVCPDSKKMQGSQPVRYRLAYLSILHNKFEAETGMTCHYSTFVRHMPKYIIKPKPEDWGTCLCMTCLNPQMKITKHIIAEEVPVNALVQFVSTDTFGFLFPIILTACLSAIYDFSQIVPPVTLHKLPY